MNTSEIAFVILSCDKFKITWKPCIDHIFNAWPNCPYPIYLLNNYIPYNDDRIINLLVGEDLNWSDSLIKGLLKLQEKRVFFIYDDCFITYMNLEEIESIFKTAITNDLESVTLRKNPFDRGVRYNEYICKLNPNTKYRNSLFLNLIKKDILLSLLRAEENAWQFEKEGNSRSKNLDFYSVYNSNLAKYHHGIVKGKWLPKSKKYLEIKGFDLSENKFETYTQSQTLSMTLYGQIFLLGNKFLCFINRHLNN